LVGPAMSKGFSLIELLVVMTLVALMISLHPAVGSALFSSLTLERLILVLSLVVYFATPVYAGVDEGLNNGAANESALKG